MTYSSGDSPVNLKTNSVADILDDIIDECEQEDSENQEIVSEPTSSEDYSELTQIHSITEEELEAPDIWKVV